MTTSGDSNFARQAVPRGRFKFVARIIVGVLLFNAFSPVFASLIPEVPNPIIVPEVKAMTGVPMVHERSAGKKTPTRKSVKGQTSLDEVGRYAGKITPAQVRELIAKANASTSKKAEAFFTVGEGYLGLREPAIAGDWFTKAERLATKGSVTASLAGYNRAIAFFYEGRYRQSATKFADQFKKKVFGFERKNAELFYRRAESHAGYHEIRSKAGITEPVQIDPLGGVAAVARVMQSLNLPHSKEHLVSYYDPEQGRWLTRDPIGFGGGVNVYAYCNDRPVLYEDALGLQIQLCKGKIAGGAASHWLLVFECNGKPTRLEFSYDGVLVNEGKGNPHPGKDDTCVGLALPSSVEECLCRVANEFRSRPDEDTLGGQKWKKSTGWPVDRLGYWWEGEYHFVWHNCQDFVNTALESCGGSPFETDRKRLTRYVTPLVF